jgi:hypothetical protein
MVRALARCKEFNYLKTSHFNPWKASLRIVFPKQQQLLYRVITLLIYDFISFSFFSGEIVFPLWPVVCARKAWLMIDHSEFMTDLKKTNETVRAASANPWNGMAGVSEGRCEMMMGNDII